MVPAALGDRPPLEQPDDRDERGVEDRHREDEERQQDRRHRGSRDLPARGERQRGEREAEDLAARVAHEDRGGPARPEVKGQEADAGGAEREREHQHHAVRVLGHGVERVVGARDRGERRREPVHVVEQVERVRDPDEPDECDRGRQHLVVDDLDREPAGENDRRRAELGAELRDRAEREEVVGEPGGEEEGAAAEHAEELGARVDRAGRDREQDPGCEAEEDPDSAEARRRSLVPALSRRNRDEPPAHEPTAVEERSSVQRTRTATAKAAIATAALTAAELTAAERSPARLGLCVGARLLD